MQGQGVNQPRPALVCHPVDPIGSEKLNYFVHDSGASPRPAPQQHLGLQSGFDRAILTNKIGSPSSPKATRYCSQLRQVADSRPLGRRQGRTGPVRERQPSTGLPFPHRLGVKSCSWARAAVWAKGVEAVPQGAKEKS